MSEKKKPLTDPKAVKKSQKVYDQIVSGKVKDAKKALGKAHGRGRG